MASMEIRLRDLATSVATAIKASKTLINGNAADLAALTTVQKATLVGALNELKSGLDAVTAANAGKATINDASAASLTQTWSITKIASEITNAINVLTVGAPGALNTLDELAAALGDDANFGATITTALANRVRVDIAGQGLTLAQKANARANMDAYGSIEIGNPDTDFVAIFDAGLVT